MKLFDRAYPDIVRDLLTLLTGGTAAEQHEIGATLGPISLKEPPVRRVSNVQGEVMVGDERMPYRFTERDFELLPAGSGIELRFRESGKKPAPSSLIFVNYYPLRLRPTPINDVNVGSVARTLLETVAFELASMYRQLQLVYDSAFVETATGDSLDKVAALVDVKRLRRGHPVGKVRFIRRASSPGDVHIPIGTVVGDGKGARYSTSNEATLPSAQSSIEVWVHGERPRTKILPAGGLVALERAIAGIDRITNEQPTYALTEEERDDQLAERARGAIHGAGKGTLDAIRFAVTGLPFVSAATLVEQPEGVSGTVRIDVALTEDNAARRDQVRAAIDAHRPAGVSCELVFAGPIALRFAVALTLKGASLSGAELKAIEDGIAERLVSLVRETPPGGVLRKTRIVAAVLADQNVADAGIRFFADSKEVTGESFSVPAGKTVRLEAGSVTFSKAAFEEKDTAVARTVKVDLDLVIVPLDASSTSFSAFESDAKKALAGLVENLAPGAELGFDRVMTAIRDESKFAIVQDRSAIMLREPTNAFIELRLGDPAYRVPSNTTLTAGEAHLRKEES